MTQSVNSAERTTIEDQKCPEMHYEPIDKVNSRPLRSFLVVWGTYMLECLSILGYIFVVILFSSATPLGFNLRKLGLKETDSYQN